MEDAGERDRSFDVVVLGGGTAGLTAALAARHAGASVALLEQEPRLGGDCSFYGCVPSKALIEVANLAFGLRRAAEEGLVAEAPPLDFRAVAARRARIVEEIAVDERDERFERAGIAVLHGEAELLGAGTVHVDGATLRYGRLVVATGSDPAVPPVEGIETVPYLTNRSVLELEELPARLLVLGGGAIGLELAQAFARLGSRVTVVELLDRLLPREEPEAGALIADVLRGEGIELRLGVEAESVRRDDAEIVLRAGGDELRGDALLVATGRRGHTGGFGLERLGVALEKGYIVADRRCRSSVAGVFAAGDVTGGLQFTHVAAHEGRVAGLNAAGKRAKTDERVTPWVTFTDPEVAHVGLTEAEARERRGDVRVAWLPMDAVDRPRIVERPLGFVKLVTAKRPVLGWTGGGELVGAQIVGPRAGELIQECALAMQTRVFAGRLTQTIHAYPTASMAVQQGAAQLFPLGRVLADAGGEGG
ncbi:MAG TPA: NAD(P)/FAD-dependent oxidoreductase [Gaiellaceae bacterium]|nr:NAD(P)/FAD-dependent oxidoreductase [Gaiellaceae bacterium]